MPADIDFITSELENVNLDEDSEIDCLCQNLSKMQLQIIDTKDIEELCFSVSNICLEKKVHPTKLRRIIATIYWTGTQALNVGPWKDYTPGYVC